MKLLVTGKAGQVVQSLVERAEALDDVTVVTTGRPEFDLGAPESIAAIIAEERPDVLVSAAAYTAVDKAESDADEARRVNATGPGALAKAAAEAGIPIIHLSTDYVFPGDKTSAYVEDDATGPLGVYGRTKLEGEQLVAANNPRHVILRTAWVYSPFGGNFVKTMLRLAKDRDALNVVADQVGNPTSALDIADGVIHVARQLAAGKGQTGVFHLTGSGETNWAEFARAIFAASAARGGPSAAVGDITTADYPTPAKRPANSRLDGGKLAKAYGWRAPEWPGSLEVVVERLLAAPAA